MRLRILAVGKMKAGPESELYDRFEDRIVKTGRSLHLAPFSLVELPESRTQQKPTPARLKKQRLLLQKIETGEPYHICWMSAART